jgi:hypothetical protein
VSYPELPGRDDPFDEFETVAEVCAYIHRKLGEEGLRLLLTQPAPRGTALNRDDLLDIAAELSGAGLSKAAAVVSEIAATRLPMDDLSFCAYTPDVPANQRAWLRAQQRRQAQRADQRKQWTLPPRVAPRKTKPRP